MGRSTGISRRHKSGTGNMEKREKKTPIDFHSKNGYISGSEIKKRNESTSPVITAPSTPNQVVTHQPRTFLVQQNSSILSNIVTTPDTQVLNSFWNFVWIDIACDSYCSPSKLCQLSSRIIPDITRRIYTIIASQFPPH
jgi:hypothetical protein